MSHFFTLVIVDDDGTDIRSQVENLLSPYDENIDVSPYERECSCIGRKARGEAREQAEAELGTVDDFRASFKTAYPELQELDPLDEKRRTAWKAHVRPLVNREKELFEAHPDKDKPDPTCGFYIGDYWEQQVAKGKLDGALLGKRYEDGSGCGGTGKQISTYSPG